MPGPTLVVMAAGIGSRYGGLKQIDPVGPNNEIIIDYSIYDALKAGFKKVVFVIRRDIEQAFREKVGKNIEPLVRVVYVFQELSDLAGGFTLPRERLKPWGTAQAVLSCRDAVDTPFAVINADDFYGASAFQTLGDYLREAEDQEGFYHYSMVGYLLKNTLSGHGYVSRGICSATAEGYLLDVHECTKIQKFGEVIKYTEDNKNWLELPPDSIVSLNMWGFTPSLFAELERGFVLFLNKNINNAKAEYFLPTVVNQLIKENKARVKVLHTGEKWFGATYKEDMPEIRKEIRDLIDRGVYPEKLWRG